MSPIAFSLNGQRLRASVPALLRWIASGCNAGPRPGLFEPATGSLLIVQIAGAARLAERLPALAAGYASTMIVVPSTAKSGASLAVAVECLAELCATIGQSPARVVLSATLERGHAGALNSAPPLNTDALCKLF